MVGMKNSLPFMSLFLTISRSSILLRSFCQNCGSQSLNYRGTHPHQQSMPTTLLSWMKSFFRWASSSIHSTILIGQKYWTMEVLASLLAMNYLMHLMTMVENIMVSETWSPGGVTQHFPNTIITLNVWCLNMGIWLLWANMLMGGKNNNARKSKQ